MYVCVSRDFLGIFFFYFRLLFCECDKWKENRALFVSVACWFENQVSNAVSFIILYGDFAPVFYHFLTIDLFGMDPHIIFIRPTLKQSPKTTFIASRTLNLQFNRMSSVGFFFSLCFHSFQFYYFVWNINPMHSNSTIYHNEWADGAHYFHIASQWIK